MDPGQNAFEWCMQNVTHRVFAKLRSTCLSLHVDGLLQRGRKHVRLCFVCEWNTRTQTLRVGTTQNQQWHKSLICELTCFIRQCGHVMSIAEAPLARLVVDLVVDLLCNNNLLYNDSITNFWSGVWVYCFNSQCLMPVRFAITRSYLNSDRIRRLLQSPLNESAVANR
jgi:hypothetical protein